SGSRRGVKGRKGETALPQLLGRNRSDGRGVESAARHDPDRGRGSQPGANGLLKHLEEPVDVLLAGAPRYALRGKRRPESLQPDPRVAGGQPMTGRDAQHSLVERRLGSLEQDQKVGDLLLVE